MQSDKKIIYKGLIKSLHTLAVSRTTGVIDIPNPFLRPEILPFTPLPKGALEAYEVSWQSHLKTLVSRFKI